MDLYLQKHENKNLKCFFLSKSESVGPLSLRPSEGKAKKLRKKKERFQDIAVFQLEIASKSERKLLYNYLSKSLKKVILKIILDQQTKSFDDFIF